MENKALKIGDKVRIINNEVQPEYIGQCGIIIKINPSEEFYKVKVGGIILRDYANRDCLELIKD